jgi:hypothetical protein
LLGADLFRTSIGAGTGNGTVTSVNGTGSYGGLTLTGTVTGSGDLTLGGTPTGSWPISITGNAASVNTVQVSTNADFYLTFADANNGSPTSEFLYTIGSVKVNPSTGALTASSFVKSGGTSSQFLMADGSVSTGSGGTVTGTGTSGQIAYWNGTSSITGESNLFWDATNDRLGIANSSPSERLTLTNGKLFLTEADPTIGGKIYGYNDTSTHLYGGGLKFQSRYYDGANYVYADRLTIKGNGNVGIGTTSPSAILDVNSASQTDTDLKYNMIVRSSDAYTATPQAGIGFATFFNGSQNLVLSGIYGGKENATINDFASKISFATRANGGNITERMRITSGGNVLIGTTTDAGYKLDVNGNVRATGFFNSSDNRLKDLTDYDYNVSDIKPITYLWKDGRDNKKHVGYSAQEVQKVMPDAVNEDEKGFLSVNYVEVLVAQVELLNNRMAEMQKEIELLKSKI